jgi:hypothetical protein
MILGNGVVSLILGFSRINNGQALIVDTVYFIVMTVVFVWIVAPPLKGPQFLKIQLVYRMFTGAILASLTFGLGIYLSADMHARFRQQAQAAAAIYTSAAGSDVVQRSLLEQYLTADTILAVMSSVAVRGGLLVSCVLLFFISRQASLVVTWFVRRRRPDNSIAAFHAEPWHIWVLSFSLLAVLGGGWGKIFFLEIAGWNVLMICSMLYLVQGTGITVFVLTRKELSAGFRILLHVGIVLVIISPGINVVALGGLILLGIAENWVPFRALKTNGPSSTPGTGE